MAAPKRGDFIWSDACAPFESLANFRLNALEIACMDARGLPRRDRGKDLKRYRPPAGVERVPFQPQFFKFARSGFEISHDLRLAVVQKIRGNDGETLEALRRRGIQWGEWNCEEWRVLKIA